MTPGERDILSAFCCDLYVATPAELDLRGMHSMGFEGAHELVVGGFKQASCAISCYALWLCTIAALSAGRASAVVLSGCVWLSGLAVLGL